MICNDDVTRRPPERNGYLSLGRNDSERKHGRANAAEPDARAVRARGDGAGQGLQRDRAERRERQAVLGELLRHG